MNFQLKISNHNSVDEGLSNLLRNIPEDMLFYKEHGIRHPLATYNIAMQRVYNAFSKFILENKTINQKMDIYEKNNKQIKNSFLNNYVEILDSIMAFIDGTYIILKTLYPISSVSDDFKFNHEWVKSADPGVSYNYYRKINDYRNNVATKVNKIKHNTQKLQLVRFKTNLGNITGYFVEGIDAENGAIGPDKEIHKMYNGENTAISFNYDLRYNLIGILSVIKKLEDTINTIVYKKYNKKIKLENDSPINKELFSLLNEIENIKDLFFIDEYDKEIPIIKTRLIDGVIDFKYKKTKKIFKYSGEYIIEGSFEGDGVSQKYTSIYYK